MGSTAGQRLPRPLLLPLGPSSKSFENEFAPTRGQEPQSPSVEGPQKGTQYRHPEGGLKASQLWVPAGCGTWGKLFTALSLTLLIVKVGLILVLVLQVVVKMQEIT